MGGGQTTQTQSANGQVGFNPTSIGGGNIMVGGMVGQQGVQQGTQGSATGASVDVGLSMPMPFLMNLDNDVDFLRAQDSNVNFNGAGAGNNHVGSLDAGSGANINFGLLNLDNDVDFLRAGEGANVGFNGNGEGNNHVGSLDAGSGSTISFGLLNLDNDVDFIRAQDSNVNFNGNGAGNNHVGSLDAGSGANINFGLMNLVGGRRSAHADAQADPLKELAKQIMAAYGQEGSINLAGVKQMLSDQIISLDDGTGTLELGNVELTAGTTTNISSAGRNTHAHKVNAKAGSTTNFHMLLI